MFEKFLEDFIPSVEIHEYLKSQNILKSIVEIIYYSPCDINKKLQALKDLEEEMEEVCNTELERLKKNDDSKLVEFMKWLISDIRKERVDSIIMDVEKATLVTGVAVDYDEGANSIVVFVCNDPAMRIVEKANERGIKVALDKALARTFYAVSDSGTYVPMEIIDSVMKLALS